LAYRFVSAFLKGDGVGSVIRPLLVLGNDKLSPSVAHFDLPAGLTCPGKSKLCYRRCYARHNRFAYPQVQERLRWCYEQSKRGDFVNRMVGELYRKGIVIMRWHVSGDIFSQAYARKMLEIIGRSPHTTFWAYTRSWRVASIAPILQAISFMPNMKLWFSADMETGYPENIPDGVRVAWMQTLAAENTEDADLIFLDYPLRRQSLPLHVIDKVCPVEKPDGKKKGITCATCRFCWK
jgi:protein gp88